MSHRGNISSPAATMSSVQALREFINDRLATAAGEIFTMFEQTIVHCEEEIVRQEKLLQIARKPQIKFHRTERPQQRIDHRKTSSSLEEEEHEAPHIKEEEDIVEVTVTDGESENSLGYVRDLTTQRLTTAAGEIFTVLEQTIVQYEEEIDRQRRLLEIIWKPQIKLHRTELPQHHDCTEDQLFKQEINYFLKQEEPEPPKIKVEPEEPEPPQIKEEQEEPEPSHIEEQEELGTSQEGEQLVLKVESDSFRVPSIEEQSECGEIVCKKRKLCQNVGTVTDKKKKLCEICGERYSRRSDLLVHLSTHTGEKPYTCETCDKSFSRPSNLFVHMRTHTGEKPYSCVTCGKSFSVHSTLYRHMRTHTGEKPYPCETCGKSFSQHSNLLLHMRTHTGEKPYSCEICGKSFCRQDNFLRHMKAHKEMKS